MLGKFIPAKLKNSLKKSFRWQMQDSLPHIKADLMVNAQGFFPHAEGKESYLLLKQPPKADFSPLSPLPVPPPELLGAYGATVEAYLQEGKKDVQNMRDLANQTGYHFDRGDRILDIG